MNPLVNKYSKQVVGTYIELQKKWEEDSFGLITDKINSMVEQKEILKKYTTTVSEWGICVDGDTGHIQLAKGCGFNPDGFPGRKTGRGSYLSGGSADTKSRR